MRLFKNFLEKIKDKLTTSVRKHRLALIVRGSNAATKSQTFILLQNKDIKN